MIKKKAVILLLLLFVFLISLEKEAKARTNEFFDIPGEIAYGEECLNAWQVEEAKKAAEKVLLLAPEDPHVCFFVGKVRFYEGKYWESLDLLKKAQKTPGAMQQAEEFFHFVQTIYKTASKFKEVESEHFLFRFVEEKDAILAEYSLDTLEHAYKVIGSDLGYFPREKILVEVYPDAESFCTISTLTQKEIETSGAVAICLFNRLIITSPRLQPRGYEWLDTLAHEYVHYVIMKKTYNRVPVWLHEGLAKYEEKRWIDDNSPALPVSLESLLAEAVEKDYFITFEQMHPSLAKLEKREDTALAFAQVFTSIEYLYHLGGYPLITAILDEIKNGMDAKEALSSATGVPFNTFEENCLQYLKQKKLRRVHGIKILPTILKESSTIVDDLESVAEIEVKEAKKFAILGDLLRREGLYSAAIIEYEKAFILAKNISPQIQNKLAMAYIRDTQYSKAEEVLKTALEYYPEYTATYISLGELYQKTGAYQTAIDFLSQANRVNPFNPVVYRNLIQLYTKLEDKESAANEMRRLKMVTRFHDSATQEISEN
ncbi:tetratricopeptide repeat protein [Candidatus Kuenenia sp.]|uniref:tetratricopeptide repeat protein n=1 Tax=Candidatus Kuenenia sp. TaxID=2499824 RepID=UPI00322051AF